MPEFAYSAAIVDQSAVAMYPDCGERLFSRVMSALPPGGHMALLLDGDGWWRVVGGAEDAGWEVRDCISYVCEDRVERVSLLRKPLDGTVANNVLKYGTGAIDIDGCRVPIEDGDIVFAKNSHTRSKGKDSGIYGKYGAGDEDWSGDKGRWPANVITDGSAAVFSEFPDTAPAKRGRRNRAGTHGDGWGLNHGGEEHDDLGGSAARYFARCRGRRELVAYLSELMSADGNVLYIGRLL